MDTPGNTIGARLQAQLDELRHRLSAAERRLNYADIQIVDLRRRNDDERRSSLAKAYVAGQLNEKLFSAGAIPRPTQPQIVSIPRDEPTPIDTTFFAAIFLAKSLEAHQTARNKGFYDKPVEDGTRLALIHSEVSEVLDVLRSSNPDAKSEKIPNFSKLSEELADIVIRVMDFAVHRELNLAGAIEAKMAYNTTRPRLHGKKF